MSLIINFVPVFTVFASLRNAFFSAGKSQGNSASSLQSLVDQWLGFLVFTQAAQVRFLGRELRSHSKPPLTAVSPRSFPPSGFISESVPLPLLWPHSIVPVPSCPQQPCWLRLTLLPACDALPSTPQGQLISVRAQGTCTSSARPPLTTPLKSPSTARLLSLFLFFTVCTLCESSQQLHYVLITPLLGV